MPRRTEENHKNFSSDISAKVLTRSLLNARSANHYTVEAEKRSWR